jgi:hypothetical protein
MGRIINYFMYSKFFSQNCIILNTTLKYNILVFFSLDGILFTYVLTRAFEVIHYTRDH